jgi:hypothetical protein
MKLIAVVGIVIAAMMCSAVSSFAQVHCITLPSGAADCSNGDTTCLADESSVGCFTEHSVRVTVPKARHTHAWRTCEDVKADIISPVAFDYVNDARVKVILATMCGTAQHPHTVYIVVDSDIWFNSTGNDHIAFLHALKQFYGTVGYSVQLLNEAYGPENP